MLIARSTQSELAQQVQFLKIENQMLRQRLPKRLVLTNPEKRLLVTLGQALGAGVPTLLTIAVYPTYRRWVNQFAPPPPGTYPLRAQEQGRPAPYAG
jgi:putative transposase